MPRGRRQRHGRDAAGARAHPARPSDASSSRRCAIICWPASCTSADEVRLGTVLFSDLRGFTALAERMAAGRGGRDVLNQYFSAIDDVGARRVRRLRRQVHGRRDAGRASVCSTPASGNAAAMPRATALRARHCRSGCWRLQRRSAQRRRRMAAGDQHRRRQRRGARRHHRRRGSTPSITVHRRHRQRRRRACRSRQASARPLLVSETAYQLAGLARRHAAAAGRARHRSRCAAGAARCASTASRGAHRGTGGRDR